jgi:hypothetical protein
VAQLWEILKQLGLAAAGCEGAQNIAHGEPSASNTRLAQADGRVDRDAIEQVQPFTLKPFSWGGCPSVWNRKVIAEANRIFGFDGWERSTLISRCVAEHERPIGRDRKSGWGVTYIARVRITITAGNRTLIREGSGAGHGIDSDLGLAHESALKEAETDATKRALMTFGNPFGLALYDKQQRQVSSAVAPITATSAALAQKTRDAVADIPLDPAVIAQLQERIKALAPARLEAFSKGFRSAFQVPDAVPSLAGLITTSRHQRWIEGFLAEAASA